MTKWAKKVVWLQYSAVAVLGYLLGCIAPSEVAHKTSATFIQSRYLVEHEAEEGAEEHEEHGGSFDIKSDEDVTIVTCIVLLLIFLTIVFEYSKEYLEERATRNLKPLVEKLFGEMTVLGFLSIVTFLITKAGWFSALSEIFFDEEEELLEIFEFVHFTIFFIMIFYVLQVLILVAEATATEDEWLEMEKIARAPHLEQEWTRTSTSFRQESQEKKRDPFKCMKDAMSVVPLCRDRDAERRADKVLFKVLRDEFVLERSPNYPFEAVEKQHRVGEEFNFGRYLGINQGSVLSHIVEVSVITWTIFAILTAVYYVYVILVNESVKVLAWSWVGLGWIAYFFLFYFERHLMRVREMFLQKDSFLRVDKEEGMATITEDETTYLNALAEGRILDDNLPVWTSIDIDEYNKKRSWLTKWIVGGTPTRQHSIYWFDRRGPKLYLLLLQFNMLFLGIYAAMNVLGFIQYMYANETTVLFIVYVIFSFVPLLGMLFDKKRLVALLSQVVCIGAHRRPNVVADVLREEKTAHVVRAFIVIYKLWHMAGSAHETAYDREGADEKRNKLDPFELREVGRTFDAFDTNGDGGIAYDEFSNLMTRLNPGVTEEGVSKMIRLLDEDGDGEVSRDEFVNWYADNAHTGDQSESEIAHHLFHLFDRDGSGEITIAEFQRKLDALNFGFSVDEVGAIVNELDEDNSGSIGIHEFEDLVFKYYPKELKENGLKRTASGGFAAFFDDTSSTRKHHHAKATDWHSSVLFQD